MKTINIICGAILFLIVICLAGTAGAGVINDAEYGFRITIPDDWQTNSFMDGTDKVWAFAAPDNNAAIRIRTFKRSPGLSMKTLISVFEANIFSGWQKLTMGPYALNGINGKMAGYRGKFNNIDVGVGCFYTIQKRNVYIVWSMIPVSLFNARSGETDAIMNTFTLSGIGAHNKTAAMDKQATVPVRIDKITTGDTLSGSYGLASVKDVFSTMTQNIYVVFKYRGNPYPDPFLVKWIYEDRGLVIDTATLNAPNVSDGMAKTYMNRPDKGWPPGNYKVEIQHRGAKLTTARFMVK
jgi:hypothetical protein